MTDLVLVRHGETVWHADLRYAGSSDVALTPRGRREAALLATWAEGAGLTALWSSPLSRALVTAEFVSEATGLAIRADERLREVDFGEGEGRTPEELDAEFAEALAAFRRDPVDHHFPGGEDPRAACARARAALADIVAEQPVGHVLVVAHGTLIRLVLCDVLGIPLSDYRRRFPTMRTAGRTELRMDREGAGGLLAFNVPPMSV